MLYTLCQAAQLSQVSLPGLVPVTQIPEGRILWGSAVSGGSLWGHLRDGIALYGREKLLVHLEKTAMIFPLPCPGGVGRTVTEQELTAWRQGKNVFFSPELAANYFTCGHGTQLRVVLFDDGQTFRYKVDLARQMGLKELLFRWDPWCADLKTIPESLFNTL